MSSLHRPLAALFFATTTASAATDFARDVFPVLQRACFECHGAAKQNGKLWLDSRDAARRGGESGASFANNCVLARRLIERGVRVVELYDSDWDHHANLANSLPRKCKDVDRPMSALISDLKERGMLDDTLVIWAGEFGRTPLAQGIGGDGEKTKPGRDHHKDAFTVWLAGGGVKGGVSHGRTDEFGFNVAADPVHVHDLNATVLHLLGLDHERLTFKYQGREFRLTDVHGKIVKALLA